jgi:nucleotide-binding universal stress UspA family protein
MGQFWHSATGVRNSAHSAPERTTVPLMTAIFGPLDRQSANGIPIAWKTGGRNDGLERKGAAMKLKNIVIPTDLSDRSRSAVEYASNLAATLGAALHIVHVDDLMDFAAMSAAEGAYIPKLPETNQRALKARLAQIKPTAANVKYSHHFVEGVPSTEIVALADKLPADLIVMSSHGRTGLSRVLMGSVAENVLRQAKCPVLIVKQELQPAPDNDTKVPAHSQT